jgi:hypothetical protein
MNQLKIPFCSVLHTHQLWDTPNVLPKRAQEEYIVRNRAVEV